MDFCSYLNLIRSFFASFPDPPDVRTTCRESREKTMISIFNSLRTITRTEPED